MNEVLKIKQHKLLCGDITKGSINKLMGTENFDILYSDPPWGAGNLKFWNTMNSKMNNIDKFEVNWEEFISSFCYIINTHSKENSVVIIEMGLRFYDHFSAMIESNTKFKIKQLFKTRYKGGGKFLPNHIMYFSNENPLSFNEDIITDTYGEDCTNKIIQQCAYKDAVILDPCCGMGSTLKMAHKYDMKFRGNEINQARLNKAIKYAEGII